MEGASMLSPTLAALEAFDNQHDFERFAADVLNEYGYFDVVLQAPRGGADGGRDILFSYDGGRKGLAWVTLRKDIEKKFHEDASQRRAGEYSKYYLFCTAHLTSPQKDAFAKFCRTTLAADFTPQDCEALRSVLDTRLLTLRARYLGLRECVSERHPLRIRHSFTASIVFNSSDNLPQVFFDLDSEIGRRLSSKSILASPHQDIDGKGVLMVELPITDDQKFLHGIDALQCKLLHDICNAQRGGWTQIRTGKGVLPTKITNPNTPQPITRLPGSVLLDALAQNRFAQNPRLRMVLEYSEIPFPTGTLIWLESSLRGVEREQRRVVLDVPGKARIVVSVEAIGAHGGGALPERASVSADTLQHCRTFTYSVCLEAEIVRSGNHDDITQDYKAWIDWLAHELQLQNGDE
jgi:hypothetical protein